MKSPLATPFLSAISGLLLCLPARAAQVDASFTPALAGTVLSISANGGSIFAGGDGFLVRLNQTGSVEASLPGAGGEKIFALLADSEGRIYAGGSSGLSRLKPDGSPDPAFSLIPANGWIKTLSLDPTGRVVFGGSFWSQPGPFLARALNAGGTDAGFSSALLPNFTPESGVCATAIQADGRIIAAGSFKAGSQSAALVRLNLDGSTDSTFAADHGVMLYPKAVQVLATGKILVAGTADSSGRGFVRRLLPDGSVDPSFTEPLLDRSVETLAVDRAGRVLLGGNFLTVNGEPHARLARLAEDGELDPEWTLSANNVVTTLAIAPGGEILAGGAFTEIGGVSQKGLARLLDAGSFRFRPLSVTSSGDLHLSLKGAPGLTYIVETSADLQSWTVFATNIATAEGLIVESDASTGPRQFFRARLSE